MLSCMPLRSVSALSLRHSALAGQILQLYARFYELLLIYFYVQAWHRKLFQINDSATTVDAAPLAASANATSIASPSSSSTSSKPHSILGDIISDFKNKVNGTDATPAATSAPASSASAAASSADADATPPFQSDLTMYSPPCEASPEPTAYEAFTGVSALSTASNFSNCSHAMLVSSLLTNYTCLLGMQYIVLIAACTWLLPVCANQHTHCNAVLTCAAFASSLACYACCKGTIRRCIGLTCNACLCSASANARLSSPVPLLPPPAQPATIWPRLAGSCFSQTAMLCLMSLT